MAIDVSNDNAIAPANIRFISLTFLVAFVLNLLPWRDIRGVPDLLALAIAFWGVHQPRRIGFAIPFALGLLMDAANGALMGQHALAYSVLAFLTGALNRRILWFPLSTQALHMLVVFLLVQGLMLAVRLMAGGEFPGFTYFVASFIAAGLWPLATIVLVMHQRRSGGGDDGAVL